MCDTSIKGMSATSPNGRKPEYSIKDRQGLLLSWLVTCSFLLVAFLPSTDHLPSSVPLSCHSALEQAYYGPKTPQIVR